MNRILASCLGLVCLLSSVATLADEREEREKQLAKDVAQFLYPGSKSFEEFNTGILGQFNSATDDDFVKVDAWYRKKLGVDEGDHNGVFSQGKRLQSLFEDGHRPKSETQIEIRKHTSRTHFLKTPEYTLVVVLNRLETDRQTMISVTYVPEAKK